jgi:hypothetical protein
MTTCAVEQVRQATDKAVREHIRSATYAEFLYGYGASPDVDLGLPREFSQRFPGVFQQRFDRGLTIANVGDEPVRVELPGPYTDLEGRVRYATVVGPRSAEVLQGLPRSGAAVRPQRLPSGRKLRASR